MSRQLQPTDTLDGTVPAAPPSLKGLSIFWPENALGSATLSPPYGCLTMYIAVHMPELVQELCAPCTTFAGYALDATSHSAGRPSLVNNEPCKQ